MNAAPNYITVPASLHFHKRLNKLAVKLSESPGSIIRRLVNEEIARRKVVTA
jgi:predicted transcriptional regulator